MEEENKNSSGKTGGNVSPGAKKAGNKISTRQVNPVSDNQNSRTIGSRGPVTLENYQLLEKISHFDRERIPQRVVHARGAGAHGYFEAYSTAGDEEVSKHARV